MAEPLVTPSYDCDVAVIGGGPAGATAASALARAGRSVILCERDSFPRFHIGESLLASVNDVLEAIGAAELIRQAGFPRKWGATFITPDGRVNRFADFSISGEVPAPQTYQVPREQFDLLLLRHAASCGADVRERHRVTDLAFDDQGVTLTVTSTDGTAQSATAPPDSAAPSSRTPAAKIRARAVIDASGRTGILSRRFSLRLDEPGLANVAIFSHYANVPRADGRRAGDIRVIARADDGWFWMIPISDELMSVGVVLPQQTFLAQPKLDHGDLLDKTIAETPAIASLMQGAERRWPVRVERDFSYASKAYAGDRWITVGDAGSFLDPVFSSGVAIALESALEGAHAIDKGLSSGDLSARALDSFNRRQRRRYRSFRRFVTAFYTNGFRDLFFSDDPPKRMFNAIITVLAGYWHPSWRSRVWLWLFFVTVRLQSRLHLVPPHLPAVASGPSLRTSSDSSAAPADGAASRSK